MPAFTQTFLTDKVDRLTSYTASNLSETYSYDRKRSIKHCFAPMTMK